MDTNEKLKKNSLLKISILLGMLIVLILFGYAFAKYITSLNGEASADIATLSFKVNDKTNESFTINLAETREGVEQEAEVAHDYIGPGTAGKFNIVIDARDCEVSLEYDVNMDVGNGDNTKFPKNLVFYSDEQMQNAIFHEGNTINFNGFIGHNYEEDEKVKTIPIYWKWAYITGSTPEEQEENDELDTYWMGKPPTSFEIKVIGKQVNKNPTSGQYAVTFDANGGTLKGYGNSSQATKQVTYGEKYGELPIPTREGYTFEGWNGKNLLNIQQWLDSFQTVTNGTITVQNNTITIVATENDAYTNSWLGDSAFKIKVNPNTKYTVSWKSDKEITAFVYVFLNGISTDGGYRISGNNATRKYFEFTTKDDTEYVTFRLGVSEAGKNITYYDLQIEENMSVSSYEPYIISSSTPVTQNKDHTLTAIWIKENSISKQYTVTFDANGGTLQGYGNAKQATKQVTYGEKYGELPTPTREGYKFAGWETNIIPTNKNYWVQGGIDISGAKTKHIARIRLEKDLQVSPNTKYTISVNNEESIRVRMINFYDKEGEFISTMQGDATYVGIDTKEFTTSENAAYINVSLMYIGGSEEITVEKVENANISLVGKVENTTIVTQPSNHVLVAIWEK